MNYDEFLRSYINTIIQGDCLDVMREWPDNCMDCIICDLPYGTTACSWDIVIPFEPLWEQYRRIAKDNCAIVLFGSQPFTTDLIMSNREWFKYEWIWNKKLAGNGILAKIQPLKIHENISIFCNGNKYFPQMKTGKARFKGGIKDKYGTFSGAESNITWNCDYYPESIVDFSGANMRISRMHPTQKPLALLEYLVKTYSNEGDLILDNCAGSGTTLVAAKMLGRRYIGIELEPKYYKIAQGRLDAVEPDLFIEQHDNKPMVQIDILENNP